MLTQQLMDAPVLQGGESYLLTRWVDAEGFQRVVTRLIESHAEPGPLLAAHEANVAGLIEEWPTTKGIVSQ